MDNWNFHLQPKASRSLSYMHQFHNTKVEKLLNINQIILFPWDLQLIKNVV